MNKIDIINKHGISTNSSAFIRASRAGLGANCSTTACLGHALQDAVQDIEHTPARRSEELSEVVSCLRSLQSLLCGVPPEAFHTRASYAWSFHVQGMCLLSAGSFATCALSYQGYVQ